jgi:2'-5' RNA ligase
MKEESEGELKQRLDELAESVVPFFIETNHFNCFRPRTIFIEPDITIPLETLYASVAEFALRHPEFGAKPDKRKFHPHITIATRDLSKKDFAEAWPLFENKKFEASWQAAHISLLSHNQKKWDVVHTSHFKSFMDT